MSRGISRQMSLLAAISFLPHLVSAQPAQTAITTPVVTPQSTIDKIEVVAEITKDLVPGLADPKKYGEATHDFAEFKAYYEKNDAKLASLYPAGVLGFYPSGVLQSFSGAASLTSFDVHYVPFLPIAPEATMELSNLQFFKIKGTIADGEVPGLRAETTLEALTHGMSANVSVPYRVQMTYVSSLNARILGFSFGQMIPGLSSGAVPARIFEYNGSHEWQEHSHLKKEDQISHPIKLTNVAHGEGRYSISTHPDFALQASFAGDAPVVMTFFLWKGTNLIFMSVPPAAGSRPDFIFQLVLRRAKLQNF